MLDVGHIHLRLSLAIVAIMTNVAHHTDDGGSGRNHHDRSDGHHHSHHHSPHVDYEEVRAVVLIGGEGTRLRPLTNTIPKPVLPLVDRPFIGFMIEWLGRHGVDDIVLACGSLPDKLREVLGDGGDSGPRLTYVQEPDRRGTAGSFSAFPLYSH